MAQKNRLEGGLINRKNPCTFEFNGQSMQGFEGDTLASALLANDVRWSDVRSNIIGQGV